MTAYSYQLYCSRNFGPIGDTLSMLADAGFTRVEGYGGLFANLKDREALRGLLDQNNLTMPSGHFGLDMVEENGGATVVETARALGIGKVIVPAIGPTQRKQKAAGWAALGKRLAEAAKPVVDAGLTFGWHNHDFEFAAIDSDDKPLDLILGGSDDIGFEFDVAWAVRGNEDPLHWIAKYKDRIIGAHVKDIAPAGENRNEDGWADLGTGTLDWPGYMAALRDTGTDLFVLEHDNPSDDARFARNSLRYMESI